MTISDRHRKALNLIRSDSSLRGLTSTGEQLINSQIDSLLSLGLVTYGSGRRPYKITAKGKASL